MNCLIEINSYKVSKSFQKGKKSFGKCKTFFHENWKETFLVIFKHCEEEVAYFVSKRSEKHGGD